MALDQAATGSFASRSSSIIEVFLNVRTCGGLYQGRMKSSKKSLALTIAAVHYIDIDDFDVREQVKGTQTGLAHCP